MAEEPATSQIKFDVKKVYLKDVSFESPQAPTIFKKSQLAPEIDVQLRVAHTALDSSGNHHEVVLVVTVTAKEEDKAVFLVEVQQAGAFEIVGVKDEHRILALEVACPNVLLPFAREAISELVRKGGFPQLLISPVNFEALYRRRQNTGKVPAKDAAANNPQSEKTVQAADDATNKPKDEKKAS